MLMFLLRLLALAAIRIIGGICSISSIVYYFKKAKKCSEINDKILLYPANSIAEMIRKKQITSEYVIKAYISRIKDVNPLVNAVVQDRFEQAINEAKYTDQMIFSTKMSLEELQIKYPLLGVPITIKESIAVEGLSNNAGKIFPNPKIASSDADVVRKCKHAGAIPLLVSNTPELSSFFETYNKITGITRNPYDSRRTPGGSSGGEGALLGSGASLIGLGSDIFGSLRLPAHFCGIWAHKPSCKVVSVQGHYPDCKDKDNWVEIFNLGPMARYASDLKLLLNVILENDYHSVLRLYETVHLHNMKFYYMKQDHSILTHKIDKDITDAIIRFIYYLKSTYGCEVQELKLNEFKYSPEYSIIKVIGTDNIDNFFEDKGKGAFTELFRYITCRANYVLIPILCGILKRIISFLPESVKTKCNKDIIDLRGKLNQTLGDNGVLLYPCHPTGAHYHYQLMGKLFDYSYMGIFNVLGFPVTSCPVGLNSKKLPIGIQVIAATNNDRLTLAVAQEIEKVFGGWIPPHTLDDPIV